MSKEEKREIQTELATNHGETPGLILPSESVLDFSIRRANALRGSGG